ncbi:MAG: acetyl-CoA/propionyl-CoA carboxylase, biotin carboxylase, biotin carboxyl carrier protein [Solirubrobacteraceae bacterium]|nr:acetyl-CoA/propionyl-CoA carboxylase, biotin carboxylase, biotin carboxyl carrier protein [Solirubrobacteraceae bacterium]
MFSAVLVANRGEIAVRVIATLRRLGIRAIAVCSQADADALHVRLADEALTIGPAPAAESYLRVDRIVDAALRSGAQAVHPGYGFLSERAQLARACADAGLVFVGPPPEAIELLGDKARAKALADAAGVATVAGIARSGLGLGDDEIVAWAQEQASDGLPLLVKAAAGGGGRGMRVVATLDELAPALKAARREALASFGDDALLVERYVERARHVEVQLLADAHGAVVHLGERECSLQRRHQKLVEESPSPAIDDDVRARMGAAAVAIARAAGYVGAGTCEFLVPAADPRAFWFLELNARLQVEHAVTELVCGLDLVEAQLRVAAGEPLSLTQEQVVVRGHAIEARVCAEGPGFLPRTGRIVAYREPTGPGIRVDSGVCAGSDVSGHYDSLLAKVVAHAPTRELALERLDAALARLVILGPQVNTAFLRDLLADPRVRAGELDTGLVERLSRDGAPGAPAADVDAAAAAALARTAALRASASDDPWERLLGWRADGPAPLRWRLAPEDGGDAVDVLVAPGEVQVGGGRPRVAPGEVQVGGGGARGAHVEVRVGGGRPRDAHVEVRVGAGRPRDAHVAVQVGGGRPRDAHVEVLAPGELAITLAGARRVWAVAQDGAVTRVGLDGRAWGFADEATELRAAGHDAGASLSAPMPGSVLLVHAQAGDSVAAGDVLVVLESMKMELQVAAPAAGTVERVAVAAGDRVASGQLLVEIGAGEP